MPLDAGLSPAVLGLAEWLADCAAWLPGRNDLAEDLRSELAGSAVLRPLLNDWLAREVGLPALDWDAEVLAALRQSHEADLAVALLKEENDRLLDIARFLGAVLWADQLRRTVLKTDRDRLVAQLGADAMTFGLRRAPVMAKALMDGPLSRNSPDPVTAGYALAGALVARVHPCLFDLWRLRLPHLPDAVVLTDRQAEAAWAVLALRGTVL